MMANLHHGNQNGELTTIYDSLFEFESKKKQSPYPIHKKLDIQGKNLLEWLSTKLNFNSTRRILDAGCGTGNTLFWLFERYGSPGIGLSLSKKEISYAQAQLQSLPNQIISFETRDLTSPLNDLNTFDFIICIESLKHVANTTEAIKNLMLNLKDDGYLVIVDDFLMDINNSDRQIASHQKLWSAPSFNPYFEMNKILSSLDKFSIEVHDLTSFVPRKSAWLRILLIGLLHGYRLLLSDGTNRRNANTYLGALILEALYASKKAGYFAFIAKKIAVK